MWFLLGLQTGCTLSSDAQEPRLWLESTPASSSMQMPGHGIARVHSGGCRCACSNGGTPWRDLILSIERPICLIILLCVCVHINNDFYF